MKDSPFRNSLKLKLKDLNSILLYLQGNNHYSLSSNARSFLGKRDSDKLHELTYHINYSNSQDNHYKTAVDIFWIIANNHSWQKLSTIIEENHEIGLVTLRIMYEKNKYPEHPDAINKCLELIAYYFPEEKESKETHRFLEQAIEETNRDTLSWQFQSFPWSNAHIVNALLNYIKTRPIQSQYNQMSRFIEIARVDGNLIQECKTYLKDSIEKELRLPQLLELLPQTTVEEYLTPIIKNILSNKVQLGLHLSGLIKAVKCNSPIAVLAILNNDILFNFLPTDVLFEVTMQSEPYAQCALNKPHKFSDEQRDQLILKYPNLTHFVLENDEKFSSKTLVALYGLQKKLPENSAMILLEKYFLNPDITVTMWKNLFNQYDQKLQEKVVENFKNLEDTKRELFVAKFYNDSFFKGNTLYQLCTEKPFFASWILPLPNNLVKAYDQAWILKLSSVNNRFEDQKVEDHGKIRKTDLVPLVEKVNNFYGTLYESKSISTRVGLSLQSWWNSPKSSETPDGNEIKGYNPYSHLAPKKQIAAIALDNFDYDEKGELTERGLWQVCAYIITFYYNTKSSGREEFMSRVNSVISSSSLNKNNNSQRFKELNDNLQPVISFFNSSENECRSGINSNADPGKYIINLYRDKTKLELINFDPIPTPPPPEAPKELNRDFPESTQPSSPTLHSTQSSSTAGYDSSSSGSSISSCVSTSDSDIIDRTIPESNFSILPYSTNDNVSALITVSALVFEDKNFSIESSTAGFDSSSTSSSISSCDSTSNSSSASDLIPCSIWSSRPARFPGDPDIIISKIPSESKNSDSEEKPNWQLIYLGNNELLGCAHTNPNGSIQVLNLNMLLQRIRQTDRDSFINQFRLDERPILRNLIRDNSTLSKSLVRSSSSPNFSGSS